MTEPTDETTTPEIPTDGGVLEIAAIEEENEATESNEPSDSDRELDGGGDGTRPNQLIEDLATDAQDDVMNWLTTNELFSSDISADTDSPETNKQQERAEPLAFVGEELSETGLGLLEALILGGASLYGLDRVSGGKLSDLIQRVMGRGKSASWMLLAVGRYESVITIFLKESERGLKEAVICKVTDERLEILAEQMIPMSLEAAAAPEQAELEETMKTLVKKAEDQMTSKADILFFDPLLVNEQNYYKDLSKERLELEPKQLQKIINSLSDQEVINLMGWIEQPKKKEIQEKSIRTKLQNRRKELKQAINNEKSLLIAMLELSLAMNQQGRPRQA